MGHNQTIDRDLFSYQVVHSEKIFIYWKSKQIKILKGKEAVKFLLKLEDLGHNQAQQLMAKVTGNFKRGNE